MKIESSAFAPGGEIPSRHTFEAEDISPPLSWSDVPPETKSLALIVDTPDPAAPGIVWVHWILYNLPPLSPGLPEAVPTLPAETCEGLNDWSRTGYFGPNPLFARRETFFRLYALDTVLDFARTPGKAEMAGALQGHVLAEATLIGTYESQSAHTGASPQLQQLDAKYTRRARMRNAVDPD